MADISSLGEMHPVEELNLDLYKDAGQFRMPPKGEYTLQAPESFTFGRTGAGALSATIDSKIADGEFENIKLRFQKVSAKVFKRSGVNASQLGDYLRACGFRGKISNEQEQADAVEQTANHMYKAKLDWRAYCSADGFSVEGMEKFVGDGNGGYLPYYEHPILKDPEDATKPLRLRAQLVVPMNGYVPAEG